MQVSLQDTLDTSKLQHPIRLNTVNTDITFNPEMVVIDRTLSLGHIVTDDARVYGKQAWNDNLVLGSMSRQDRTVMVFHGMSDSYHN